MKAEKRWNNTKLGFSGIFKDNSKYRNLKKKLAIRIFELNANINNTIFV